MADFISGLGLVPFFSDIILFVLVVVILYGFLRSANLFKASVFVHLIISFTIGILVLISPLSLSILKNLIPPFVLLFIFIILVLLGFMLFGVSSEDITATIKGNAGIKWALFIACTIIVIAVLSNAFGQSALEGTTGATDDDSSTATPSTDTGTNDFSNNLRATFFHPKILGFIAIMLIGVATVGLMATESK